MIRMNSTYLLMLVTLSVGLSRTAFVSADESTAFQWTKSVTFDSLAVEELVAVPLDSDVYAATQNALADLRLRTPDGKSVAFAIRQQATLQSRVVRRSWKATKVQLKPLAEGSLEIQIELNEKDPQPSSLSIITPLKNFEQRVQIFALTGENLPDGEVKEQTLVDDGLIFDYSQYMDVSRREIKLPQHSARSYRILVGALTSDQESQLLELTRSLSGGSEQGRQERTTIQRRPFRIDRIELHQDKHHSEVEEILVQNWPVSMSGIEQDATQQQTIVNIKTQRQPITALTLSTGSRNFSRPAEVQVQQTKGIRTSWITIASENIRRFEFRNLKEEELVIKFPEQREEQFRLVIHNRDSEPLDVTSVSASGPVHELVFMAQPDKSYSLLYADPQATKAQLDTAALEKLLRQGAVPIKAALGVGQNAPDFKGSALDVRGVINNPLVLGAGICVLVGLLGWALYGAGRRISELPPDETQ
ncbi:MAG: hypothetical protein HQ518_28040 [Rhodopirellula sp.]|nr:hypothetical protein [Rhodopirellula sp.]